MITNSTKNFKDETNLDKLTQLAIEAAGNSNWEDAAKINKKIVRLWGNNVEALNRLARAQVCAGDCYKAEKAYKKVLSLDPYNIIAKKNLEKIAKITNDKSHNGHINGKFNINNNGNLNPTQGFTTFLYEPGKTKVINLLNLAPPTTLAILNCGDKLVMHLKNHGICINSLNGTYLGALPDDLAHRLLTYIKGGNKYDLYIKYATTKSLTIFIKETERSAKFQSQPSFQSTSKN